MPGSASYSALKPIDGPPWPFVYVAMNAAGSPAVPQSIEKPWRRSRFACASADCHSRSDNSAAAKTSSLRSVTFDALLSSHDSAVALALESFARPCLRS